MITTYCSFFFFFNDTATTEIYTLSLHDALPILNASDPDNDPLTYVYSATGGTVEGTGPEARWKDRKSTRLNSSHTVISYAVFCLKKKKKKKIIYRVTTSKPTYEKTTRSSRTTCT